MGSRLKSAVGAGLTIGLAVGLGLALVACGGSSGSEGTGGLDTGTSTAPPTSSTSGTAQFEDAASALDLPTNEQVRELVAGNLSCADLTAGYLSRIDDRDGMYNAVLAIDDGAADDAAAFDDFAATGPLHCAVVMVKDNIDSQGMATTAGSLAMVGNVVDQDAALVAKLRSAGTLILGKTNLSEWANFRGQGASSGWSSFGGQTNNGADATRNPCGSSSGSAAAVAAGLVSAAVGTETSGSLVCPSSVNGVVGMKPTLGLVSRTGVIPIAHSHDTAGPITRTVLDAALLLEAMAGPDAADPATSEIPGGFDFDLASRLQGATVDGKRLGVDSGFVAEFGGEQADSFNAELARLAAAGAIIVEISLPDTRALSGPFITVLTTELKADLNAYLASHAQAGVPTTLADVIAFNTANAAEVMPHFGQKWFIQAQATTGLHDPGYLSAAATVKEQAGPQGLLAVMDGDTLDALVLPTTGPAWTTNYGTGDPEPPSAAFLPAAAGYPHLTVPMGTVRGLPVGISFIGRAWDDSEVLAIGHAYESLP